MCITITSFHLIYCHIVSTCIVSHHVLSFHIMPCRVVLAYRAGAAGEVAGGQQLRGPRLFLQLRS